MSLTDNIMKFKKNGYHPLFREHPLLLSNNRSVAFTFSGTSGKNVIITAKPSYIAMTLLLHFFSASSVFSANLLFRIS